MTLLTVPWFCLAISTFGTDSGAVSYLNCQSEVHHQGPEYLVEEINRNKYAPGVCEITVYGTEGTAWAKPVNGWVPCWVLEK